MKKTIRLLNLFAVACIVLTSCKRNNADDPKVKEPLDPGAGEQEILTRLSMVLTDSTNSKIDTVTWNDPKGNGHPIIDSLKLKANATYSVLLFVFDDTKNPVDTISNEIKEEGNYHRFHYKLVSALGSAASLSTTLLDLDSRTPPQPIGLEFKIKIGTGLGVGDFNVNLRHFDNGQEKTDDITGGEQDIYVNFPTVVK